MMVMNKISRRHFLAATGAITGAALLNPLSEVAAKAVENPNVAGKKLHLAIVGTGGRGTSMWGYDLMKSYPDYIEFVGLCDKNEVWKPVRRLSGLPVLLIRILKR